GGKIKKTCPDGLYAETHNHAQRHGSRSQILEFRPLRDLTLNTVANPDLTPNRPISGQ
ncbi:unnamed protein product, partial [marine sediment metagenome]